MEKTPEIKQEILVAIQGHHYPARHYNAGPYKKVTVCGCITGCGLAQMYGVFNLTKEELSKIMEQIKKDVKAWGAGGIIATLGTAYMIAEKTLLNYGFTLLAEYPNYHHHRLGSKDDKQRLYIYYM